MVTKTFTVYETELKDWQSRQSLAQRQLDPIGSPSMRHLVEKMEWDIPEMETLWETTPYEDSGRKTQVSSPARGVKRPQSTNAEAKPQAKRRVVAVVDLTGE